MFLYDSVAFSPPLNVDFGNRYKHFCIPTLSYETLCKCYFQAFPGLEHFKCVDLYGWESNRSHLTCIKFKRHICNESLGLEPIYN